MYDRFIEGIRAASENLAYTENTTDEGGVRNQFRDTGSEISNSKLMPYSEYEKAQIERSGNVIVDSYDKLVSIVHEALTKKDLKRIAYFGKISATDMKRIERNVSNIPRALNNRLFDNNSDYSIAATYDSIQHLTSGKLKMNEADVVDYLDKLADTMIDFDAVSFHYEVKGEARKNGLLFHKAFPDGTQSTYDLYSNAKHRFTLKTSYLDKQSYQKKKSATPVPNQQSLGSTSTTHGGQTSISSISQSQPDSNTSDEKRLEQSRDADYLSAVERGDMETAQRMVDEAAERAFANSKIRGEDGRLIKVYHGTDAAFTVFDRAMGRADMDIQGLFFSPWDIDGVMFNIIKKYHKRSAADTGRSRSVVLYLRYFSALCLRYFFCSFLRER